MERDVLIGATVTVVVSDRSRYDTRLYSQFGLSLLVDCTWSQGAAKRILFDTGWDGELLLRNLCELNVSPGSIDTVVLSHAHYDHTGGLGSLIAAEGARFTLVAHPDVTRPVYSTRRGLRYIGLDTGALGDLPDSRVCLISEQVEVYPGVFTTGTIKRQTTFEASEENVYVLSDGELIPDEELDDMALVLDVAGCGLVLLTGCSHAGVVNTVEHVLSTHRGAGLATLMGGFHLLDKPHDTQQKTVESLARLEDLTVLSGHCTGWHSERLLSDAFGRRWTAFYTGDIYHFPPGQGSS